MLTKMPYAIFIYLFSLIICHPVHLGDEGPQKVHACPVSPLSAKHDYNPF